MKIQCIMPVSHQYGKQLSKEKPVPLSLTMDNNSSAVDVEWVFEKVKEGYLLKKLMLSISGLNPSIFPPSEGIHPDIYNSLYHTACFIRNFCFYSDGNSPIDLKEFHSAEFSFIPETGDSFQPVHQCSCSFKGSITIIKDSVFSFRDLAPWTSKRDMLSYFFQAKNHSNLVYRFTTYYKILECIAKKKTGKDFDAEVINFLTSKKINTYSSSDIGKLRDIRNRLTHTGKNSIDPDHILSVSNFQSSLQEIEQIATLIIQNA